MVVNHLLSGLPRWVAGMIESSPGLMSEIFMVYEARSQKLAESRKVQQVVQENSVTVVMITYLEALCTDRGLKSGSKRHWNIKNSVFVSQYWFKGNKLWDHLLNVRFLGNLNLNVSTTLMIGLVQATILSSTWEFWGKILTLPFIKLPSGNLT